MKLTLRRRTKLNTLKKDDRIVPGRGTKNK